MNLISSFADYITGSMVLTSCDLECRGSWLNLLTRLPGIVVEPQLKVSVLYVLLFVGICYFLTVVLEIGVLLILRREHSPGKIGKLVLVANLFSYLFLVVVFGLAKAYFSSSAR